jgi:hypothetical protein
LSLKRNSAVFHKPRHLHPPMPRHGRPGHMCPKKESWACRYPSGSDIQDLHTPMSMSSISIIFMPMNGAISPPTP